MKNTLESLGRARFAGILVLAAVFIIGGLAGAAFERTWGRRPPHPPPNAPGALPPILPEMRAALRLTPEQDRALHEILERNRPRVEAVTNAMLPRLRAITDSVRVEIRALLTPEQQKIFDAREPALGPPPGMGPHPPFRPGFGGPPPDGPPPGGPPPGGPPPGGPPR
jgi:uncharacterized membrane protein